MSASETNDPTTNTAATQTEGGKTVPAAETTAATAATSEALIAAKKDAADNYERYLRAVADLENFRRRTVKEKDELRQFAAMRVLEDMLPVMDNLGLGIAAAKQPNADLKSLTGGVEMVLNQFKSALSGHGLKEIAAAGQVFDANFHESLSELPSADVPEGNVLTVVRTGYTLNGRLLRAASVVVSSGPAKTDTPAA